MRDVVPALLVKEPSHGYDLRRRLTEVLGPLGETLNAGQICVTLTPLEKAGLVVQEREDVPVRGPRRKVVVVVPRVRGCSSPPRPSCRRPAC